MTIGPHRLACGDCRDVMADLAPVDAIVSDIPYDEVNRASGGLRNLDKADADTATFTLDDVIEHSTRLAATSYVFCGTEQVSGLRRGFVQRGLTTRLGIWEKTNPSPMNGERLWLSSVECCVFARKPKAYFSERCASSVWRGPVATNQRHPTQKPLWLMKRLVRASVPLDGTVLDFCMGSGTTILAAHKTGRSGIGIELNPRYFDIACKRVEDALHAEPLLAEAG